MQLVQDLEITKGTKVLLRCDLNLPQDAEGRFTDFFRLESSIPTISYLLDLGATVYIIAHLGNPKGKKDDKYSLRPLAEMLANQIGQKVDFVEDPFNENDSTKDKVGVALLENLRFWPGEEDNSGQFAQDLVNVTGAEFFIQDGFGTCHREHVSFVQIPTLLPSAAGLLLQKEVEFLNISDYNNLSLIVGGAKVESKLPVVLNFVDKASSVLTGGVVANTLLVSSGKNVAASLVEKDSLELAASVIASTSKSKSSKLYLPQDYLAAASIDSTEAEPCDSSSIKDDQLILDLGLDTIKDYQEHLLDSDTVIWAGTLGYAENPVFAEASKKILDYVLELKTKNKNLKIIIGGGDTVDFVRGYLNQDQQNQISHLSTGGSASLLVLSGQELPGIEALHPQPDHKIDKVFQPVKRFSLQDRLTKPVDDAAVPIVISSPPPVSNTPTNFPQDDSQSQSEALDSSNETPEDNINFDSEEDSVINSSAREEVVAMTQSKPKSEAPQLIVNLKSNFNLTHLKEWLSQVLDSEVLLSGKLNLSLAIPSIFLEEASSIINSRSLSNPPKVYAENISIFESGAHTGEIAASMLKNIASGTLIGHSERRFALNEAYQDINLKIERAINANLQVILCVGSKSQDRLAHKEEVYGQLSSALVKFDSRTSKQLSIAYEPVYAIGTGQVPEDEFLEDQLNSIQQVLSDSGLECPVLYGGSVDPANTSNIMKLGFKGLLAGTIGLDPAKLTEVGINMLR
jgi:phosphoglycerate kinase